jgi:hypothetical protein
MGGENGGGEWGGENGVHIPAPSVNKIFKI